MSTQPKTSNLHAKLAELQQKRQREEEERKQVEERLRREAEVEAELVRQIVVEEERERVAEEVRRLEEEERLRWEVEHRAEAVRQVQAPASPMRVDNRSGDGSGDDEDAEEETENKKGKGKETENGKDGWMIVRGSRRCLMCRKDDTEHRINLVEIEKWQKNTEKGRAYKKAPPATSFQRCMEIRRKPCILPAMEECRRKMGKPGKLMKPSVAPSASSGGKRPLEDAGQGLLPKKKQKKVERKSLTEGEFRTEVVDTLEGIERRLRQQWVEAARLAKATELQNYLLQQLVVALGGGATVFGKLPAEGKLVTEDKVDGSYKTGESGESSEEESGEESGEGSEE